MAHILVVDDERNIRRTLSEFLTQAKYKVSVAENVEQAFEILADSNIDVVLTDIIMPRITGVQLLKRIKELSPEIEVVLMTGEPTFETASEAIRTGAIDYLSKPITKDMLLKTVANVVKIKSLRDERVQLLASNQRYQTELELLVEERTSDLVDSEQKFRQLTDNSLAGIYILLDQKIQYCNDRFAEIFGYESSQEVTGLALETFIHPDDFDSVEKAVTSRIRGETKTSQHEVKGLQKNGGIIHIEILGSSIQYKGQKAAQGMLLDITKRTQARELLQQSEEKYRFLFENINDALAITQNGKYIHFNHQFCEMLGYTASELDQKDYREIISKEGLEMLAERDKQRKRGGQPPTRYETTFLMKDGQVIHVDVNVTIINYLGQTASYAVLRDISERKKAEADIEAALLKAKQANEVKDQFIANISHEIRTPLNSILGFSDLFKQRYGEMVSVKDQDIFQYITNASNRLMRTVDSILNISQLNAGAFKLQKCEIDLNSLIKNVLEEIRMQAVKKNLELIFNTPDQQAMIFSDNHSLHQAILNLVDNAIKYTNAGKIELSLSQKQNSYRLSIQDTGIGISEEYQKRIFEPYTQESEGFTKNFQGIGLGLALTKRYLELNDINLELESSKSLGTTFTLIFSEYEGS